MIGVCVAAWNRERYLPECLDSLLANDFPDFKIYVCTNGSIDSTDGIAKDYMKRTYGKVEWVGNTGVVCVGSTKHDAVDAALHDGCDMIQMLDSDDKARPTLLSRMSAYLIEQGTDWVNCHGAGFGGRDVKLVSSPGQTWEQVITQNSLTSWGMFKAKTLREENFRPGHMALDDWELWVRLLHKGYKYAVLDEVLVDYRWHDDQETRIWLTPENKDKRDAVVRQIYFLNDWKQ